MLITALITPFQNNKLDSKGLRKNLRFQIDQGIEGFLVFGSTGEGMLLSKEEKKSILDILASEAEDLHLMVNISAITLDQVIENIAETKDYPVDSFLVSPPPYLKPTQNGLIEYFSEIAERASAPLVLYNIPSRTGVTLTLETLKVLASHPNIMGVKDSTGGLSLASQVLYHTKNFKVFAGDDIVSLPLMSVGVKSLISVASNLIPKEMKALVEGKNKSSLYQKLYPLFEALTLEVNPIPIKYAMQFLNFPAGNCRKPLTILEEKNQKILNPILEELCFELAY